MKKDFKKIKRNGGAAMLISVVFFLFISLAIISGLVVPTVREFQNSNVSLSSKKSYFLAESGGEDAVYRISNNMIIGASEVITLDSHSATTTITDILGQKEVISVGDVSGYQRKTDIKLETVAGVAFNYGIQVGAGGMTMNGGSSIVGSIYSNGSIIATNGVSITGTAIAADSPALAIDQANDTPSTPTGSINFRNVSGSQDFAQSFQISNNTLVNKIQFYIKKVGSPSDATIRLVADNNNSPSAIVIPIGTISLSASSVTTDFSWKEISFTSNPSLIPNATYWLVIDNSTQSASNYYVMGANDDTSYASGTAKTGVYNGTWNATNLDGYFKIYTGGITSTIGGATYPTGFMVGSEGTGDAWATTVKGTSAQGHMYCQTGLNNNKVCDTTHGVAPALDLPYTSSNVTDWKDIAAAGGIITGATKCPGGYSGGNCIVDWRNATFGPGKITGNLTVNGGGTLTLTGTVWVVGSVTVNGGGKIKLPTAYALNSETIVSDNLVNISGGGSLGSGDPNSFLFIVSTSKCPFDTYCSGANAITVTGGAGAIAVDAQNGAVSLSGGADLDAAVGNAVTLTGGTHVTYNAGLASPSFVNGPSGAWEFQVWKETP
jgi:hypothetical protein